MDIKRKPSFLLGLLFFIILISIFWYQLPKIAHLPPQSVHQWRQTDCLSFTYRYYEASLPFGTPQTMNLIPDEGYAMGEFPILYYISAQFYDYFGVQEAILRIITYLFFVLGTVSIFLVVQLLTKNSVLAFICSLFFYSSPLLVYYGFNFLANVPALGTSLFGGWLFLKYYKEKIIGYLWAATAVVLLAALFKPIIIFNLLGLLLIIFHKDSNGSFFARHQTRLLIAAVIFTVGILGWQYYVYSFNQSKNSTLFLQDILPIWELESEQRSWCFRALWVRWATIVQWDYLWPILGVGCFVFIIFYKQFHKELRMLAAGAIVGHIVYMLLYFKNFDVHDYYLINTYSAVIFLIAALLEYLFRIGKKYISETIIAIIFFAFTIVCMQHVRYIIDERYFGNLFEHLNPKLEGKDIWLDNLGIPKEAKIVSFPDPSVNISLYFFKRQGWTDIFEGTVNIAEKIDKGASYLIINRPEELEQAAYQPFLEYKLASKDSIFIFDLRPYK